MDETPDKGPIRFLKNYIIKHDKRYTLEVFAIEFSNIDKWIANEDLMNYLMNTEPTNI